MDYKRVADESYKKEVTMELIKKINKESSISNLVIDDQYYNKCESFTYDLTCDLPFNSSPRHIHLDSIVSKLAKTYIFEEIGDTTIENMLVVIKCKSTDTILHSYYVKTGLLVTPIEYNIKIDHYIIPEDMVSQIPSYSSYQFELDNIAKVIIGRTEYKSDDLSNYIIKNIKKYIKFSDKIKTDIIEKKLGIQESLMIYSEILDNEELPLVDNNDKSAINLHCVMELLKTSIQPVNIKLRPHNLIVIRCKSTNDILYYYYQKENGKTIQFNKFNLKIDYYEVPERYLFFVQYFESSYEKIVENLAKIILKINVLSDNPYIEKIISIADSLFDYVIIEKHFKNAIISGDVEFIINDIDRETIVRFFRFKNIKPVITYSIIDGIHINRVKILL